MKRKLLALFLAILLLLSCGCAMVVEDSDDIVIDLSENG